ncbi:hypothetical protein [Clostridium neonatale]|uniref:hypothetical protein n=1 Tax=Clostridium neonatale TaxID=137838 RepID=UPI002936E6B7|nr:hypothetical protein [Clostridium neonatale]
MDKNTVNEFNLRPCKVDDKKAFFHKWSDRSEIIPPSPMVGGHSGGELKYTVGIVEYEDGTVHMHSADSIRFVDWKVAQHWFE